MPNKKVIEYPKRVCVIGGGPAGVITAATLLADGHNVRLLECKGGFGGTWHRDVTYVGSGLQTQDRLYGFAEDSDEAFDQPFRSSAYVAQYLCDYAARHGVKNVATFHALVERVEKSDNLWSVRWRNEDGQAYSAEFDCVAVCTGTTCEPFFPSPLRGVKQDGEVRVLHSSQLTSLEAVTGKRVVVVGGAKSATECATACAGLYTGGKGAAREVTLVARRLHDQLPRKLFGLLSTKYVLFSRFSEGFNPPIDLAVGGYALPAWLSKFIGVKVMPAAIAHESGWLATSPYRDVDGRPPDTTRAATMNPLFQQAVNSKQVRVLARPCEIVRLGPGSAVELSNGETLPCDVVVAATGFKTEFAFFDEATAQRLGVPRVAEATNASETRRELSLYRGILASDEPTIAFNGFNSSFINTMTMEVSAHWISDVFGGSIILPPAAERRAAAKRRVEALRAVMPNGAGKFTGPYIGYTLDPLLRDMGVPTLRTNNCFSENLAPRLPSHFRLLHDERRVRPGERRLYLSFKAVVVILFVFAISAMALRVL